MAALEPTTIVAVATPRGAGGLAVLRLSGRQALDIAAGFLRCRPSLRTHPRHVCHGHVLDREGKPVDEVLAWYLRAPQSFTGEDTVEVSTHGSEAVVEEVLFTALECGARLAEAGEFTRRAFMNGRLDLMQAEAVADLIAAGSLSGVAAAYGVMSGRLTERVRGVREELTRALVELEAGLDFSEDVGAPEAAGTVRLIAGAAAETRALLDTFAGARRRRDGWKVVLIGPPNAGKSTLMNALLGEERSIVSEVPGTTRDWIEGRVVEGGMGFRIIDTAGLRPARGAIERLGIEATKSQAQDADVVVFVVDGAAPGVVTEASLGVAVRAPDVVAVNKVDLPRQVDIGSTRLLVEVSALKGTGISELWEAVIGKLPVRASHDGGPSLLRERHHEALSGARQAMGRAAEHAEHGSLELAAAELQVALRKTGELMGESVDEDVLERIFSEFCIGK